MVMGNKLLEFATSLELLFLRELEGRGLKLGIDFAFQFPLKNSYILDFAFVSQKVAVEVDGPCHLQLKQRRRDKIKNLILKKQDWNLLRFNTEQIESDVAGCVSKVLESL